MRNISKSHPFFSEQQWMARYSCFISSQWNSGITGYLYTLGNTGCCAARCCWYIQLAAAVAAIFVTPTSRWYLGLLPQSCSLSYSTTEESHSEKSVTEHTAQWLFFWFVANHSVLALLLDGIESIHQRWLQNKQTNKKSFIHSALKRPTLSYAVLHAFVRLRTKAGKLQLYFPATTSKWRLIISLH